MKLNRPGIFELIVWITALFGLWAFGGESGHHYGLCPLDYLGFTWCPGCGIGRSMHYFMQGDLTSSWEYHPIGGFAVATIFIRIIELIRLITKRKLWQMY